MKRFNRYLCSIGLCLAISSSLAQEGKTVIGPSNPDLYNGANALLKGDAKKGVELTLAGLRVENSRRDRLVARSNLCAGYIMLGQLDKALSYCDEVLDENEKYWRAYSNRALAFIEMKRYDDAERDLQIAETLAPYSRNVKIVRSMLLDATDPVAPEIIIDDRRGSIDNAD